MQKIDLREPESKETRDIKVLHYMNGFVPGTIIGVDHDQRECFEVWAGLKSMTTEAGKAVQICEFVEVNNSKPTTRPSDGFFR